MCKQFNCSQYEYLQVWILLFNFICPIIFLFRFGLYPPWCLKQPIRGINWGWIAQHMVTSALPLRMCQIQPMQAINWRWTLQHTVISALQTMLPTKQITTIKTAKMLQIRFKIHQERDVKFRNVVILYVRMVMNVFHSSVVLVNVPTFLFISVAHAQSRCPRRKKL